MDSEFVLRIIRTNGMYVSLQKTPLTIDEGWAWLPIFCLPFCLSRRRDEIHQQKSLTKAICHGVIMNETKRWNSSSVCLLKLLCCPHATKLKS
mmetsp:Transcript_15088/g.22959  ORF Transcript_15088/g.22959 Transcript_15088/m.22959 type:complete len:93 (+) Transcript_15088:1434-1712(+)